jgi:predicted phage tail protein
MRSAVDYNERLGLLVGLAAAGLAGVVVALLISAHLMAGHSNLLDAAGLSWTVVSLGLLGGVVVIQPLLVHEWTPESSDAS